MPDRYTAVWVSHTSISDFLKCPRAYYLKNVYKDPQTGHKFQIMSPPLALGQVVHEVLESLSVLPTATRFKESLLVKLAERWPKIAGKKGGFSSETQEQEAKQRAEAMMQKIMVNPGVLKNQAVKINQDLPHYWLSEEDNIILCGKIDWLEYLPDSDSVHIIDFKTSRSPETEESLQLPIYYLLVSNCQKRPVTKASYWYLDLDLELQEKALPDLAAAKENVLQLAKQMKLARQLRRFKCPEGPDGCRFCRPLEAVVRGEAELVGVNDFGQDVYILNRGQSDETPDSIIL